MELGILLRLHHFSRILVVALLAFSGCGFDQSVEYALTDADSVAPDADQAAPDTAPQLQLVDTGLVVRYFMDEASSGTAPASLIDSAPSPLALPISYGQASFIDDGNRGLHWPTVLGDGVAQIDMGGNKLDDELNPSATVTMEIVIDIDDAGPGPDSQIVGLRGGNPDFMLAAVGPNSIRFYKPFGVYGARWTNVHTQERMVLHLVYNASDPTPDNRIQLFKDGVLIPKSNTSPPDMNQTVGLNGSDGLVIGNDRSPSQSIEGTIYYVAIYKEALSSVEVANNAARLLANDDR